MLLARMDLKSGFPAAEAIRRLIASFPNAGPLLQGRIFRVTSRGNAIRIARSIWLGAAIRPIAKVLVISEENGCRIVGRISSSWVWGVMVVLWLTAVFLITVPAFVLVVLFPERESGLWIVVGVGVLFLILTAVGYIGGQQAAKKEAMAIHDAVKSIVNSTDDIA